MDGGAQICVITQTCVEKMGLVVAGVSGFRIRLANHQKVKCLGVVRDLEVEAYAVKTVVDFHVMPAGLGAYPIILGRPWLRAVNAVQDWRRGTISVHGKTGDKKLFDMDSKKPLGESSEDEEYSSDEESSTASEVGVQAVMRMWMWLFYWWIKKLRRLVYLPLLMRQGKSVWVHMK